MRILLTPPAVRSTVRPSICPSCYLLLNHRAELYQTCYITSLPLMVTVCASNVIFLCVRPCVRRPSIFLSHYLLNTGRNSTKICYIISSHGKGVREQHYFSVRSSVRPSICLSRYLLLNHWVEFNQTWHITSFHSNEAREQHYFSMRPSCVHLSVTLSPPKPLGGIQPNLLHHFPS